MAGLAVVRDLREVRDPVSADELEAFEIDLLANFVLARSAAGLSDGTVRGDASNLEQIRDWFGRPLWEMEPTDADEYFGRVMRNSAAGTRLTRAGALRVFFEFLEIRHKVELHRLTGRVVECPLDEINTPRGRKQARLRIPPTAAEVDVLFNGWGQGLSTCRKFAPSARNYAAARLMAQVGVRVNEVRGLDLADVKWHLGAFGKLHVRMGKGSRGSGPRERMVSLIDGADRTLRWYIEDVWGQFEGDHTLPCTPLFPSERRGQDGASQRITTGALRLGVAGAVKEYLPGWQGRLTPHVLRHYCASELYLNGADLLSIQEHLGHEWVATTMKYVHVHKSRIEEAWTAGQQRAGARVLGLAG